MCCLVPRLRSLVSRGVRGVMGLMQARKRTIKPRAHCFPALYRRNATVPGIEAVCSENAHDSRVVAEPSLKNFINYCYL